MGRQEDDDVFASRDKDKDRTCCGKFVGFWSLWLAKASLYFMGGEEELNNDDNGEYDQGLLEWEDPTAWDAEAADRSFSEQKEALPRCDSAKLIKGLGLDNENGGGEGNDNIDGSDSDLGYELGDIDRSHDYIEGEEEIKAGRRKIPKKIQRRSKMRAQRVAALWDDLSGDEEDDF
mmetsp:Transcript_25591/g.39898  ORF Transcript_25591/g.39898 Transcript_25591/m.39898 type:complete len:176 (-) Transcript_25591:57-584(-)|eukprot:CAMPEP_0201518744 /NCGR_PEP_ID=MMETSP0161_2-20130828/9498_1 /ASSEMBLY_ACC=CAM_ASM_000251 /TAXON_ID=180227 /ORGANISM="Neoparamoeba aestuarina, Strain SoJaBio B1-5/56/2" /LENGTH=175 /DNA_ID=CAMNT_0047916597 /DNA_START=55 /DNA_END=582 /DNA_ORIENTATION=-